MGHFDVSGFYDESEKHDPHGYYRDDSDAVGIGCMFFVALAFLAISGALVSLIEAVATSWT